MAPHQASSNGSIAIVESMEEATVDVLIDEDTSQWNNGLIDGLFAPHEVEIKKKKIPLARAAHEDALYWSLSSNGHYTYKTS